MNKPGDRIDITMISEQSGLKMYSVDFFGNTEAIEIPKDGLHGIGKESKKRLIWPHISQFIALSMYKYKSRYNFFLNESTMKKRGKMKAMMK